MAINRGITLAPPPLPYITPDQTSLANAIVEWARCRLYARACSRHAPEAMRAGTQRNGHPDQDACSLCLQQSPQRQTQFEQMRDRCYRMQASMSVEGGDGEKTHALARTKRCRRSQSDTVYITNKNQHHTLHTKNYSSSANAMCVCVCVRVCVCVCVCVLCSCT